MAEKNNDLQKLRPCTVNGGKALFHMFYQESYVMGESIMIGGHSAGQMSTALALIELSNGKIKSVFANDVVFTDRELEED